MDAIKLLGLIVLLYQFEIQSWRRGAECACKSTGCGFDPQSRRWNIYFTLIFLFLRSGVEGKARRWVLPLNTQCLQNSAESGERSVLTRGSLCLSYYVRDTAWSWKKNWNIRFLFYCYIAITLPSIDWLTPRDNGFNSIYILCRQKNTFKRH